ncbi:MAG: hypothetical protein CO031_02640 [Candidatus Nealsonbacteria bacterium CG_4_9_14_0_2_um_filter_37_38]|uniref:Uncharacterized protein n=1 Tax=Candidatus Nealsonbacteria bacterium CG_4_10_14_0_8_um_filter_37_14 TaxID=1974684 RepID=A0A2M7R5I2_9BACT|nr:MAG: hypothetical protein COV63_01845 [Candidatus Nealsonbacteria bacterium CG11_big_fil_rev_8_21_14_0_20_37_68]PIW92129.1 MAG: hypothetical protein COZ89_01500 [Candidatus Nealsonbacteria bacterium CG_4_8_14_3_um_filter_37_23]PIY88579.1 MAG: hypothetical protein COY73_03340 [Candidatus Nealsonbacteria bacterium CG_4_10_14_0_8_um_filter_37_14]PJC51442.1 MAG: hypothetical protein CO031_02640 [Candidatus Nealsonbacteria bacterium CG_4_9_14_0_2_um_filter_37_38]
MAILILLFTLFWFAVFTKELFFWLWLWQLKEYHMGRFRAHFEAQKFRKIISSFWRLKFPKFTKKIILISFSSILLEILMLFYLSFFLVIVLTILFFPVFILSFQTLTVIWRKIIIEKAKKKRNRFKDLLVIGITGSYGKTSTKEFLATILSEKFRVLKTKEHQNSEVGISQCILNDLKPEHEIFICEMGAYNRGGIKLLCDITKPKIGILTGINEQHMATFGSQENIIKAKYELIESLPAQGLAVFNGNNKYCRRLYSRPANPKKFIYSTFSTAVENVLLDIWAKNIKTEKESVAFRIFSKDGESADFRINILGKHSILNILGAVAVAKELGMRFGEITKACEKIEPWQGGIQIKKGINGLNVIDATYSANLNGVISHLEYLKIWPGKKVIVMPCLIELGRASKEVHKRIGQKVAEVCDLAIITTKDRFKEIKEGAGDKAFFIENPKDIFEKIKNFLGGDLSSEALAKEDVVLLESRVPNQLIKQLLQ